MARNRIQFQKGLSEAHFVTLYGNDAKSDAKRTLNPRQAGQRSDEAGQLVRTG